MVNKITQGFNNLKGWIGRNPTKAIALSLFLLFSWYEWGTFGADKSHRNFDNKIYESIELNDENNTTLESLISDNYLSISPRLCKAVMDGENRFKNKNRVNAISDWLEKQWIERCDGATWGSLWWILSINWKEGSYGPFQVQREALDKYKTADNAQYDALINQIINFKFNGETLLSLLTKKGWVYEWKTEKDIIDMIQNEKLSMNDAWWRVWVAFGMVLLNKIYERLEFMAYPSTDEEKKYVESIVVALRAKNPEKALKNCFTLFYLQLNELTKFLQWENPNLTIVSSTWEYGPTTQKLITKYLNQWTTDTKRELPNENVAYAEIDKDKSNIFYDFSTYLTTKLTGVKAKQNEKKIFESKYINDAGFRYLGSEEWRKFLLNWISLTFNHQLVIYASLNQSNILSEEEKMQLNRYRNDFVFNQNKKWYAEFINSLLKKHSQNKTFLAMIAQKCYNVTGSLDRYPCFIPEEQDPKSLFSNEVNTLWRCWLYLTQSGCNRMYGSEENSHTLNEETSLVDNTEVNTEKNTDKPTDEPTEVNQQNHYYQLPANTIISNNKAKDRAVKIESNWNGFRLTYGNQLEILWTLATQDPEFMNKLTKKFGTNEQGLRAAMNNNQEKVRAMFVDKKWNSFTYGKNWTRHWHQKGKDDTIFFIKID